MVQYFEVKIDSNLNSGSIEVSSNIAAKMSNIKQAPQKYEDFQQKYVYTKLDSVSLGSTEPYHIYGVVFDASIPYVKQKPTC